MTTLLLIVGAYILGMMAIKMVEDIRLPDPMRVRDWVFAILVGWLLVPLSALMMVLVCCGIGLETVWKFVRKVW